MFLRPHFRRRNGQREAYWALVESFRTERGPYAYRTEFMELTTIKQATNWLIEAEHLPENCRIRLPLTKPTGTDTHCWKLEELEAIRKQCAKCLG